MTEGIPYRAILATSDKRGVIELATALHEFGWELAATAGTRAQLEAARLPVLDVAALAEVASMMGGRVKTLTLKIFAGLLMRPSSPADCADAERWGIAPFHLIASSFYELDPRDRSEQAVNRIDVGGPAMLRAAAKNHAHVVPLSDPADYPAFIEELRRSGGDPTKISLAFRRSLAARAFGRTAAYDLAIAASLGDDLTPDIWRDAPRSGVAKGELPPARESP